MKKNFKKSRWLFTMLLLVITMIMPSMMWAESITPTKPNGEGTAENPYQIGTAAELYWFAGLVNGDASVCTNGIRKNNSACAVLTQNIIVNKGQNANDVANSNGIKEDNWVEWTPIGYEEHGGAWNGTFDGKKHYISGLFYNKETEDKHIGLFGYLYYGGKISNVGIIDSYFQSNENVGGICGYSNEGTIENCYNESTIVGTSDSDVDGIGGVCGQNSGFLKNCYNKGTIIGGLIPNTGGVCGRNGYDIANCYNIGNIVASDRCGGVCGDNQVKCVIENCYYLKGCNAEGTTFTNSDGTSKTIEEFKSGEVTYLLSQGCTIEEYDVSYDGSAWGQDIATEEYPVPNSPYKVLMAAQDGEDDSNYWATFSNLTNDATLSVPSDRTLKVYNATVSGGKMTLTQRGDNQVAKEEGVLLKTDGAYVNAKANETNELAKVPSDDNHLVATPAEAETVIADAGYKLYRLTYKNAATKEDLGFYLSVDKDNNSSNGTRLKATPGKAYLQVYEDDAKDPSSAALARSFVFGSDSETTGIEGITIIGTDLQRHNTLEGIFDLQGRKITNPTNGIYIKNNKKVIIK